MLCYLNANIWWREKGENPEEVKDMTKFLSYSWGKYRTWGIVLLLFKSNICIHDMIEYDHITAVKFTNHISIHPHTLIFLSLYSTFGVHTSWWAHHELYAYSWSSELWWESGMNINMFDGDQSSLLNNFSGEVREIEEHPYRKEALCCLSEGWCLV